MDTTGEINKISKDIPLMLEHLKTEDDYNLAAQYIRSIAKDGKSISKPVW